MTQYIVHLYRVMRLTFDRIEAESSEAAAHIARDTLTGDADDIADCDGEDLSALVNVAGETEYERSRMIDFESEWLRKTAASLLKACRMVVERWDCGDLAEAARACDAAIAQATGSSPPWEEECYSVLLLYPDYANDSGTETYHAFVNAPDPRAAVAHARREAAVAQGFEEIDPEDFAVLLVMQGHHAGEPLFDK